MDYLTVDRKKYQPHHRQHKHHRITRSASPFCSADDASVAEADTQEIRIDVPDVKKRRRSLFSLHKASSSESSADSSLRSVKSSNSLVCGTATKKQHRRAQVTEVYRPRCYTDPGLKPELQDQTQEYMGPILIVPDMSTLSANVTPQTKRKHYSLGLGSPSVLGSLIKQTLKVTTASVGLTASNSEERLTQFSNKPLSKDVKKRFSRSTSSVSTLSYTAADINSMAPLHTHAEAQSDTCLNTLTKQQQQLLNNTACSSQQQQQQQHNKLNKSSFCQQLSLPESIECDYGTATTNGNTLNLLTLSAATANKIDTKSLRNSSNSLNPLVNVPSTSSIRSGSSNSSSTAKHEQNTMVATTTQSPTAATTNTEKEKKRKEVSSSRVKKFHRHFTQVPKDEKLINYFSCALVSDILLQGHLYITEKHFAFYSNVFGYVTKVVIPTASVTKISKEKTAKIIPNAVGVATAEERHVFGSFISREAAFRLMCSVCPPMVPVEILPKAPADIEICEEYSIEDDSSCSISGNESPPQQLANGNANDGIDQSLLRRPFGSSVNIANAKGDKKRMSDLPLNAKTKTASNLGDLSPMRNSTPPNIYATATDDAGIRQRLTNDAAAAAAACTNSSSTSGTPSHSSSPITVVSTAKTKSLRLTNSLRAFFNNTASSIRLPSLPTELRFIYLGVVLAVLLSLFSVFLLYRVLDIEAKANLSPFNFRSGNDDDIFHEALRWQKELQAKSAEEAQTILSQNLEQIAKVRRSLETLSMLIHDRSSALDTVTPSVDAAASINN